MSGSLPVLHGFFRSSASWRVRIALHLKGVAYEQRSYALRAGEQRSADYLRLNPQGLVPSLEIDGTVLTQSMAICEYLDETRPDPPLLGATPLDRQKIRALAQVIGCDVHPVQNLKVLRAVKALAGEQGADEWAHRVSDEGLAAYAVVAEGCPGPFSFGPAPTLADICLIPHLTNARRVGVDIRWPRIKEIEAQCMALPAFSETVPDKQPDFKA